MAQSGHPTMKRAICLALALAAIFATTKAVAEPNKEQYEVQERCGKRASKVFEKERPCRSQSDRNRPVDLEF
jgi:hypothetical protein